MTTKYCVFGEGPNDIGITDPVWGTSGKVSQEGCYSGFYKAVHKDLNLECIKAKQLKNIGVTSGPRLYKSKSKNSKKAYMAAMMAALDGADILIMGRDVDRGNVSSSRHLDRERAVIEYRNEFEEGYKLACEENPEVEKIQLVVIVPLCELEAWLLADENAFSIVVGFKRDELPKNPEEMHGETDAKEFLHSLFTKNKKDIPGTSVLYKLAVNSSPKTLEEMCPVSYPPFLAQCNA